MMATLRRSGFATSAFPDGEEGFSTDKDIFPVYRSSWLVRETRQDLLRALAELLIIDHLARVLPGLRGVRQVVVRDGDVEPRRCQVAAALGDVLLAARDLLRLALRRILRRADVGDLVGVREFVAEEAVGRLPEDLSGARPRALLGKDDAEVIAGFAVAGV